MTLYNCRKISVLPHKWRMVKFSDDLEVEASYELSVSRGQFRCQCFAANRPTCRHRKMLALFIQEKRIDTGMFYDYDKRKWHNLNSI